MRSSKAGTRRGQAPAGHAGGRGYADRAGTWAHLIAVPVRAASSARISFTDGDQRPHVCARQRNLLRLALRHGDFEAAPLRRCRENGIGGAQEGLNREVRLAGRLQSPRIIVLPHPARGQSKLDRLTGVDSSCSGWHCGKKTDAADPGRAEKGCFRRCIPARTIAEPGSGLGLGELPMGFRCSSLGGRQHHAEGESANPAACG